MTELEIITELHIICSNLERLTARKNELTEMLYNRDEFVKYIKEHKSIDNNQQYGNEQIEDNQNEERSSEIDENMKREIIEKCRRGKGLPAPTVRGWNDEHKAIISMMLKAGIIKRVRINTNYYYKEA